MRLAKLELSGFKSFAKKTEIVFGNGVTAVIGPNGSGKSNIADAIKWVLGEQSARQLRGSKMEDVIFAGTQSRRPVSMCEVTLTFDNSDGSLKTPYTEVAVTRRVYRSGEGEYELCGTPCRLKDILDLFRDTGIGKDGYSIVGQGKVDEVLSNKSGERRAAIEEAAGVMRYRVRKEEAVRKLEKTRLNLERLNDIRSELESRIGPLEEQSRTAREYLKLSEELKDIEVNLFLYQYDRSVEKKRAAEEALALCRQEEEDAENSGTALQENIAALELQIAELDKAAQQQQNELMQMLSGVESRQGEAKLIEERLKNAESETARLDAEYAEREEEIKALLEKLDGISADTALSDEIGSLTAEISDKETELFQEDAGIRADEEAVEAKKNALMDALNRLADARSGISRFETMEASIRQRLEQIQAERDKKDDSTDALQAEWQEAEDALAALEAERDRLRTELNNAKENRTKLEKQRADAVLEAHGLEKETGSIASRLRVLREMAKSREGYGGSVRALLNDAEQDKSLSRSIIGVVAELLRVPKKYELAVSMSLGSTLQNIVTPNTEDAKKCIEHLRRTEHGRVTFLPIESLHAHLADKKEQELLSYSGVIGFLNELVGCEPGIEGVRDYLLCRTILVKDLDAGISLRKNGGQSFTIATLDGDIIAPGGSMTGGSPAKQSFSLLSRERELKELAALLDEKEKALSELEKRVDELGRSLVLADAQNDAFLNALHEAEINVTRQQEKNEIIKRDIDSASRREQILDDEEAQLHDNLDDILASRENAAKLRQDIETENAASRKEIMALTTGLAERRRQRDQKSGELTELKVRFTALSKELSQKQSEHDRLAHERASLAALQERNRSEAEQLKAEHESLKTELEEMLTRLEGERADAGEARAQQAHLNEERTALQETLSAQREKREETLKAQIAAGERRHKQEMLLDRISIELSSMQEKLFSDYELTYENALALKHEIAVGAAGARAKAIHAEIRSMGEIHVSAIEEFDAVNTRYQELDKQVKDLEAASNDLTKLIAELTDSMEKQFLSQFETINANFDRVFAELFGGGHAELRLADKAAPLDCEIDVIAQPPGKKLQLLSLLSGGERALTAIALVFAMLQLKPPAFCLLDEIESALDEVNVSRFAEYVKTYSGNTQFILITHRKGSMEVCDSLYGVSMEEKGVSKVVSARFS